MPNPAPETESAEVPRRVWQGTAWQVLGRLFGSATTFAALALLARHLEGGEFGRLTFYLAVFSLLDALTDFGTGSVAVQRTADDPWALLPVLRAARRIRLALSGLGLALVAVLVAAYDEPGAWWILAAALYPFTHALELSATVYKNRIAWGVPTLLRAIASALRLGLVLLVYALGRMDQAPYLFAMALGSATANVALHRAAARHLPKPTIALQRARGVLRAALPLGLAMVCQQAYFYADNLFVRAWLGVEVLGHYNSAMRVLSLLIMGAVYAALAGLPWMTRRSGADRLGEAAARLAQPLVLGAAAFCGLIAPYSGDLLALLFGEPFRAAGPSLVWLLGGVVCVHAGAVLLNGVVASGRGGLVLTVALGALGVNLIGNALLIPEYGMEGAAAATFVTELVVALGAAVVLARTRSGFLAVRPWSWLLAPLVFSGAWWIADVASP